MLALVLSDQQLDRFIVFFGVIVEGRQYWQRINISPDRQIAWKFRWTKKTDDLVAHVKIPRRQLE